MSLMKRIVILIALGAFTFINKGQAQGFHTSFGFEQSWGMPSEVYWTIDHQYRNYNLVHTKRFYDDGRLFFDVVLQRGDVFVNVSIGPNGRIYRSAYRYDYPFRSHVCNGYCGFHRNYYLSYRVACHSHHHHGHNHVIYRPTVVYRRFDKGYHHGYNKGYAHGLYKAKKQTHEGNTDYGHRGDNRQGGRDVVRGGRGSGSQYGSRGGGNNDVGRGGNKGNNGVRDHGVGVGRGDGQGKGRGKGPDNGNNARMASSSSRSSASNATVHQASNSRTYRSAPSSNSRARTTTRSGRSNTSGRTTRTR